MNKKLLLGAALLVGMGATFTSCVDSTESPSVTNIRNAKAEQLKSIAELNRALAEKELILANAEKAAQAASQALQEAQAAYLAAQAEYEKAQAELLRAQAALLNAQTEAEKAKLEYELKLMQAELDKKAQELAEAQAALANAQAMFEIELQKAQQQLAQMQIWTNKLQFIYDEMVKKAQKEEDQAKKEEALAAAARIKQLINEVDFYAQALVDAQTKQAKDELTLKRIQAGLQNAKDLLVSELEALEYENMYYNYLIEAYNDLIDQLAAYAGEEVTAEDYNNVFFEYLAAINKYYETGEAYDKASVAASEAWSNLAYSEYQNNVGKTLNRPYSYYTYNEKMERDDWYDYVIRYIYSWETSITPDYGENQQTIFIPEDLRGKYVLIINHYNPLGYKNIYDGEEYAYSVSKDAWTYTFIPVYENSTRQWNEEGNFDYYTTYRNLSNDGAGLKEWLKLRLNTLENQAPTQLEDLQNALVQAQKDLAAADKAYTDAVTAYNKAEAAYQAAQKALPEAIAEAGAKQEAYEAAKAISDKEGATEAQIKATADAKKAWDDANDAVEEARTTLGTTRTAYYNAYWTKLETSSALDYETANVQSIKNDIANAEDGVAYNESQVADVKQLVDDILAGAAENDANIEAFNSASEEKAQATQAYAEAMAALSPIEELLDAINDALDNYGGYMGVGTANEDGNNLAGLNIARFKSMISFYELIIEYNELDIADLEAQIDKLDSDEAEIEWNGVSCNYAELVLDYQAKIEKDKVRVETVKQLYEAVKAELEAAIEAQK